MMLLICSYMLFLKASRCFLQADCTGKAALSPELKAGILDSSEARRPQTSITKTIHVVFLLIQGFRGHILTLSLV